MAKIQHIAIFSDDPEKLAGFYVDTYGMKVTGRSKGDVWVTDGYMDVALIMRKNESAPKPGIHHFGFTLEADGLLAVCLQHEIDHLNGKVFVQHLSREDYAAIEIGAPPLIDGARCGGSEHGDNR